MQGFPLILPPYWLASFSVLHLRAISGWLSESEPYAIPCLTDRWFSFSETWLIKSWFSQNKVRIFTHRKSWFYIFLYHQLFFIDFQTIEYFLIPIQVKETLQHTHVQGFPQNSQFLWGVYFFWSPSEFHAPFTYLFWLILLCTCCDTRCLSVL